MNQFEQYVTSQAFALTLSKPMIDALCWEVLCDQGRAEEHDMKRYGEMFMAHGANSWMALERRGLITRIERKRPHVTEAGRKVFELLELANLVPASIRRAAA